MKAFDRLRASWRGQRERWWLGLAALALAATFLDPGVRIERRLFEHVVVIDITHSMNETDQTLDCRPASLLAFAKHALLTNLLPVISTGASLCAIAWLASTTADAQCMDWSSRFALTGPNNRVEAF